MRVSTDKHGRRTCAKSHKPDVRQSRGHFAVTDIKAVASSSCGLASLSHVWEFDGVLLNTAVSRADDPVRMAGAFASAIKAWHSALVAGPMILQETAVSSTPEIARPFATDYSTIYKG